MKGLFYLTVFITFFSCKENSTSADKTTVVVKSPDNSSETLPDLKSIDDIKMEHSYITSKIESGSMDSTSFDYNCKDEKNGTLIYFYEKGQLRLIKHAYNEYSHFSATDEYFLKDGALFFVFYNHLVWSFVNHNQTKDDITEKRFYIIGNRPIKCLQKKFTILSNAKDAPKSNMGSDKAIECSSLEPILEDFELLFKLRKQKEDLLCLED